MPKKPAIPPFRGISNNSSFWTSGEPFCPPGSVSNVILYDLALKDRPRIGTRPGCDEYFTGGPFGNGNTVQGCGVVSRGRTATGYTLGTATDIPPEDGAGHNQPAVTGNVWEADNTWGLTAYDYENVTATGPFSPPDDGVDTQPNRSVSACCLTPDQTKLLVGETYVDGSGDQVCRVTCRNAATLAVIWSKKMAETGLDRFLNAIAANSEWVFVCTNHFIRVFKLSDGSNPANGHAAYGFNNWSDEAIDVKLAPSGSTLYGLFLGSGEGATLGSGTVVTAGIYAQHFRSGIMKFTIATVAQVAAGSEVLTQATLSPQLAASDRYYEGNGTNHHNYLRFSEQMPWAPRGLHPTALALTPDGGFAVTHANAAWGPNGTPGNDDYFPPDTGGHWNVTKFDAAGRYVWRQDGDSILTEPGGGGFFNDLLSPTALCIAVDSAGNIYTAGRRTLATADGTVVFAWSPDGDFLSDYDAGATVRALAVMPSSQTIVAGGDENNDWTGNGGADAQLFELSNADLGLIRAFPDLGAISVLAVIGLANGNLAFTTDFVA